MTAKRLLEILKKCPSEYMDLPLMFKDDGHYQTVEFAIKDIYSNKPCIRLDSREPDIVERDLSNPTGKTNMSEQTEESDLVPTYLSDDIWCEEYKYDTGNRMNTYSIRMFFTLKCPTYAVKTWIDIANKNIYYNNLCFTSQFPRYFIYAFEEIRNNFPYSQFVNRLITEELKAEAIYTLNDIFYNKVVNSIKEEKRNDFSYKIMSYTTKMHNIKLAHKWPNIEVNDWFK